MKDCENCADILCKENVRELCENHDTGDWHWSFWQTKDYNKCSICHHEFPFKKVSQSTLMMDDGTVVELIVCNKCKEKIVGGLDDG